MSGPWTIDELAMAVQQALATVPYSGQSSGRVRQVPDRRTIRYYTTLGLLDKPSEMRGRTAYYGPRHLQQLVAIKRLQSEGKPLVQIQTILAGASDSTLATWAALPEDFSASPAPEVTSAPAPPKNREEFWTARPSAGPRPAAPQSRSEPEVQTALHLRVADGVTLVIENSEIDAESLARVQPVLEELKHVLFDNGNEPEETPESS